MSSLLVVNVSSQNVGAYPCRPSRTGVLAARTVWSPSWAGCFVERILMDKAPSLWAEPQRSGGVDEERFTRETALTQRARWRLLLFHHITLDKALTAGLQIQPERENTINQHITATNFSCNYSGMSLRGSFIADTCACGDTLAP